MNTALCLSIGLCWFRLGFPTSCLHRHVGAPTGLNPKILLHAIMKIFWIFVEQGKIMAAEAPTVPVDATPTETNSAPTSQPPSSYYAGCYSCRVTVPIYPRWGQAPIYAGLHTRTNRLGQNIPCWHSVVVSITSQSLPATFRD